MQITHEQAHRLIQLNLDNALTIQETVTLSSHLRECAGCQTYANEMKDVERLLFPAMQSQWNVQSVPLSIASLTGKSRKHQMSNLLPMRKMAIGLVFVALF